MDKIIIKNARENNLKNINLELPKNKLIKLKISPTINIPKSNVFQLLKSLLVL